MSSESLTQLDRDHLVLIAQGYNTREIARRLYRSPRTVEKHRAALMKKLGVCSQTKLALLALKMGIVAVADIPDWATA